MWRRLQEAMYYRGFVRRASESNASFLCRREGATYSLPISSEGLVNGEVCDEENRTLTLEYGKFYHMQIVKKITNDSYSIFDVEASLIRGWA